MEAQAVATRLMLELTGARLVPGTVDIGGDGPPARTIRLREARITSVLGAEIPRARCEEILAALQFSTQPAQDGLDVTVPPFRRDDVTREADLIEEVARIDGLDKLPATLPSRHGAYGRLTARQRQRRTAADALTSQGLHEIVGWSFAHPDLADRLRLPLDHPLRKTIRLANPLSTETSNLRTTLLGSLLDVTRHNRAHGATTIRLFEAGAVYLPAGDGELPREPYHAGAVLTGSARPESWRESQSRPVDFFAVKGVLAALMDALRTEWSLAPAHQPFLHPGRCAGILVGGAPVGWIGELHPLVAERWDLRDIVAGFELDLDAVPEPQTAIYHELSEFPDVREDLAVVVSEDVTAAQLLQTIRRAAGPLLTAAEVFDVYRDPEKLGPGNVSLAVRLTYRAPDRTLTDEEVAQRRAAIAAAVAEELEGRIRAS
jgi:phenylalanyl-tRNA synthetase beta chain